MSTLTDQLAEYGIDLDADRSSVKQDDLVTQTEARKLAQKLNEHGTPAGTGYIAHTIPRNAWGGQEHGWTVSLIPLNNF